MNALPKIAELIPHQPPMRFLDAITRFEGDHATCTASLEADHPFVRDGRLQTTVTLEHMAQAVAAWLELSPWGDGSVRTGFLIAVRDFQLERRHVAMNQTLTIHVENLWNDGTLGEFKCEVQVEEDAHISTVSRAHLTVLRHPKDDES